MLQLQETSRVISIAATAKKGDFTYRLNYAIDGNKLTRLHCDVYQVEKTLVEVPGGQTQTMEREIGIGYMSNDNGRTNINLVEGADITLHVGVLNEILTEVKSELEPAAE